MSVGDESLVDMLASLAAETNDDNDCMTSQAMLPLSAEDKRSIAEESFEMSQRIWNQDLQTDAAAAADNDDVMYVLQWLVVYSAAALLACLE